jgi:hypothetical protein
MRTHQWLAHTTATAQDPQHLPEKQTNTKIDYSNILTAAQNNCNRRTE